MRATYERVSGIAGMPWDGIDESRSGIVRRERKRHVPVIAIQQVVQVVDSARDVHLRIERVGHAVLGARARHQLHETDGARPADRSRIAVGLGGDHRVDEVRLHAVLVGGGIDQGAQLAGRQRMRTAGQIATLTAPKE